MLLPRTTPSLVLYLLLLLSLTFSRGVLAGGPALTLPVDRGIQFLRRGTSSASGAEPFGSQKALLRGPAVLFDPAAPLSSYRRVTVILPAAHHMRPAEWAQLTALPVRGVVAETDPLDTHNEALLQHALATAALPFPLYFLPPGANASGAVRAVFARLARSERVVLSVGANAARVTAAPNATLPGAHLHAALRVRGSGDSPRLLVTAAFDTLGPAPSGRTVGGATAAAAALELWRRFNAHVAAGGAAPFGVSVLLGNTARMNYAGTGRWAGMRPDTDWDALRLVVCLDELTAGGEGGGGEVFMHVHDAFGRTAPFADVREKAEAAAARHGIELTVVRAKTNYHHYDIRFEHEVWANRQIPAVTFSAFRTHRVDQLFRGGRHVLPANVNATGNVTDICNHIADRLARRVDFVYDFAQTLLGIRRDPTTNTVNHAEDNNSNNNNNDNTNEDSKAPHDGDSVEADGSTAGESPWIGSASYMSGLLCFAAESNRGPVAQGGAEQIKFAETLEEHMRQRAAPSRRSISTSVSLTTYRYALPSVSIVGPYEEVMQLFVVKNTLWELTVLAAILTVVGVFAVLEFGVAKTKRILFDKLNEEDTAKN